MSDSGYFVRQRPVNSRSNSGHPGDLRPSARRTVVVGIASLIGLRLAFGHLGTLPIVMLVACLMACGVWQWFSRLGVAYRPQGIAAVIVLLVYACGAITSVKPEDALSVNISQPSGYYQDLAEGFLHFKVALSTQPGAGIKDAPNPYSPARSYPFLWDASYYGGKYYLYFGVTPVVTLFLPYRIVTRQPLPIEFALLWFLGAGFIGSLCVLERARRLCGLPKPNIPTQVLTVLLLGFSSVYLLIFRRPFVYEVAIGSAYCYSMWGFYCLLGLFCCRSFREWFTNALLASLLLGLSAGSRVTFAATGGFLLVAFAAAVRKYWSQERWDTLYRGYWLGAPFGIICFLIGLYNKCRFGSWLEFGMHYQLNHLDMYHMQASGAKLLRGVAYYLFSVPNYSRQFPGIFARETSHPFNLPVHPNIHEEVLGLFATAPVSCFLLVAPLVAWFRKSLSFLYVLTAMLGFAALMIIVVSITGVSARYELDFLPATLIASTLVAWGAAWREAPALQFAVELLWVPAACFSIATGIMASIADFQTPNSLQTNYPGVCTLLRQVLWP